MAKTPNASAKLNLVDANSLLFPVVPGLFRSNLSKTVIRPDDLLSLRFEFVNLQLANADGAEVLVRKFGSAAAYMIVHFAPQNIAEQAFFETAASYPISDTPNKPSDPDKGAGDETPSAPPVQSRISGATRLVYAMPDDESAVPYTLAALLQRMAAWQLNVAPVALPPPALPKLPIFVFAETLGQVALAVKDVQAPAQAAPRAIADVLDESRAILYQRRSVTAQRVARAQAQDFQAQLAAFFDSILIQPPKIAAPRATETAIELPYRLIVSPNRYATWFHASFPVKAPQSQRVELWHTRLGTRLSATEVTEDEHPLRTIRAIWARDPQFDKDDPAAIPPHANEPFRMSLDAFDRHQIVHLTSNFRIVTPALGGKPRKKYTPQPVDVDNLMLTALGAWLNSRGAWEPPRLTTEQALSVEEWRHRGTMGRDNYVRVVYQGYLFPFGHRAALIKVTERKFHRVKSGSQWESIAYLRQRMFIIVRQPEKLFGGTGLQTNDGRSYDLQFPFTRIRITTLVTPNLDKPEDSDIAGKLQSMFWPRVGGGDFLFHLVGEDIDGNQVEFNAPLMFVDRSQAFDETNTDAALANYLTNTSGQPDADKNRRFRSLKGQKLAFAASTKPGDTQFEADTLEFGAYVPRDAEYPHFDKTLSPDHPRFYPLLRTANLLVPAIKTLANATKAPKFEFHPEYLKKGFVNNPGEVFARLVTEAGNDLPMLFSDKGDKSGGLLQPDMSIKGLSRSMGPVAGNLDKFVQGAGEFDPKDVFSQLSPLMFGCVKLTDILALVGLNVADLVPRFVTEQFTAAQSLLNDLQRLQSLANQLKAQAAGLQAKVDAIVADALTVAGDLGGLLANPLGSTVNLTQHLQDLKGHINDLLGEFNGPNVSAVDRGLLKDAEGALSRLQSELDNVNSYVDLLKNALQLPEELRVKFEWKPKLQNWPSSEPIVIFHDKNGLVIAIEVRAKSNLSSSPQASVLCRLQNFTLDLIAPASFIKLHFKHIEFFMLVGKKPDVDVKLDNLEFVGVLAFVEALKSLIPLDGFSDPPSLAISEKGIAASFSLALPSIAIGVFALSNLSLGAGFTVPFIGEPLSVRFNFCERHAPFTLQVAFLGGGGFFGITIDPHGVQILEAAFEFGATLSVNFGVASGSVYAMAGIYFKIEVDEAQLTGYFRLGGNVSVLGIISVSIELYLELRYEFASGKCVGKAVLTIEVELFFFSISVKIQCERKFAGSNGDPTFVQLVEPQTWDVYCDAFA